MVVQIFESTLLIAICFSLLLSFSKMDFNRNDIALADTLKLCVRIGVSRTKLLSLRLQVGQESLRFSKLSTSSPGRYFSISSGWLREMICATW
ncbi:hypothetical protein VK92_01910 [Burkholderia sp. LK4]|nr:hypothetical protein VL00_26865 [Burkholderia cepacia]KMN62508.1 hypothetical protein VK92_01910 [Burkholderia sp. LK4]